ncbi:MAG: sugar transferase [Planctomycetales bacterium]
MATVLAETDLKLSPSDSFSDLVQAYAQSPDLPPADWLSRLHLERPRRDLRCLSSATQFGKRCMDILISLGLLIGLSPVLLLLALLVRITSPGPVIFTQVRVGLNLRSKGKDRRTGGDDFPREECRRNQDRRQDFSYGRPFVMYKFRTMRTDAEKNGAQFAVKGDARVTPIGWFLRRTRLDELPQLWNILIGDMSFVGPRPERPEFIAELSREIPGYLYRLGLKPGLTGLAQVLNGYDNTIESFRRKVALDLLYLQNCSLWNDLKIIFRTVSVVITGKGAL